MFVFAFDVRGRCSCLPHVGVRINDNTGASDENKKVVPNTKIAIPIKNY